MLHLGYKIQKAAFLLLFPFSYVSAVARDLTGCTLTTFGSFSPSHVSFPFSSDLQAHVH